MKSRFKAIPVIDGNGDQLVLYAIRERGPLFGLIPTTRFELCTGESVEERDEGFIVLATGEKLTPIED